MLKYNFFGKDCSIDRELKNRENLNNFLLKQNFTNRHNLFLNQVHGNKVVVLDCESQIYGEQNLPKADALVTNLKNVNIAIVTADCVPILFFDEDKKIIAAAHAGWRGAKLGIVENVVLEMKNLGAGKISAIIGPAIQQKSYEVSQEFFDEFVNEESNNSVFFVGGKTKDKYLFDLPAYVAKKLVNSGVFKIDNVAIDTYENSTNFFSYRRANLLGIKDCGRNISIIGMCGA